MWLWVSCARCFSKTLKLYDFICVPIGTDRLALYTGLLQQVCVSNYAYTGAKAAIFCYVLPRGEGVRPLSARPASCGRRARTIVRAYRTLYPDAAPAQACVTADTVIVGRASGRAYNMYNGRVVGEIEYMLSC